MERNFDRLKVGRWYISRDGNQVVKITRDVGNKADSPCNQMYSGDDITFCLDGQDFNVLPTGQDLVHELPEGWEPIPNEQSTKG
jgi:hypothetical protein